MGTKTFGRKLDDLEKGPVKRTIGVVKFLETALVNTGWFKLIRDGGVPHNRPVQDTNPSFATKLYRMYLDGQFVNTYVRIVYNYRDNWADFYLSIRNPYEKASAREQSSRKFIKSMEQIPQEEVKING